MADLLEQASNWLEEQRTRHASRTVSYARGSRSAVLPASVGKTIFEVDDGYGVLLRYESRDFLVLAFFVKDASDGHGIDGDFEVLGCDREEKLEEGIVYKITVKPCPSTRDVTWV